MGIKKKRKWTVFFVIKSAGSASMKEVIQMVNEIRSIPMNGDVQIVLCINFIKAHLQALLAGNEGMLTNEQPGKFTTIFFKLVNDNAPGAAFKTRLEIIDEKRRFDITDPRWLKQFFRKNILLPNEARKYMLITWDHGRFYGIFRGQPVNQEEDAIPGDKDSLENFAARMIDSRGLKKQPATTVLTMKELADAIKWAFDGKMIDVIVMMNCFMQSLDAGYALRKAAKYLVATEGLMDLGGYNYPFIFHVLMSNPSIAPEQLAKSIVASFPSKIYQDGHEQGVRKKKITALFAASLQHYGFLAEIIDKLVDALLTKIPEILEFLDEAKRRSKVDVDIYDFFSFISFLESKDIFVNNALAASIVLSLRDAIIIESFIGNGNPLKSPEDVINNPSGLTVFIPNDIPVSSEAPPSEDDFFHTEFYLNSKWHLFVEKLNGR